MQEHQLSPNPMLFETWLASQTYLGACVTITCAHLEPFGRFDCPAKNCSGRGQRVVSVRVMNVRQRRDRAINMTLLESFSSAHRQVSSRVLGLAWTGGRHQLLQDRAFGRGDG